MALRALKTDEEIAGIPLDQEILIELPGGGIEVPDTSKKIDPDAKTLQEQLEAAQAAQATERTRAEKAERDANEARKLATEREREVTEARRRTADLESDVITGGLSAAQNELGAAEAELERAGEAGDWKAVAKAQSRIARAQSQIVGLESGAAEVAERAKVVVEPRREAAPSDPMLAIDTNPNLMPAEKQWLKDHPDAILDQRRNNELSVGYERAMKKGLVRGTPAYFAELETFMGYKTQEETQERDIGVQAPPSRNDRGNDGRPTGNRVTLTPEERAIAQSMGVSETNYALGKQKLDNARRADPDRYK